MVTIELVPSVAAAAGPLPWLPTAQAGCYAISNLSKEVVTILTGHPVYRY